jgi:hypothetical protein
MANRARVAVAYDFAAVRQIIPRVNARRSLLALASEKPPGFGRGAFCLLWPLVRLRERRPVRGASQACLSEQPGSAAS